MQKTAGWASCERFVRRILRTLESEYQLSEALFGSSQRLYPQSRSRRTGGIPRLARRPLPNGSRVGQHERVQFLVSACPDIGCTSFLPPFSEVVFPFLLRGNVSGDDCEELFFRTTNNVNGSSLRASSKDQTAMSAYVPWIILDDLTFFDYLVNLSRGNHTVRARHLSDSMGEKEKPLPSRLPDFPQKIFGLRHD